MRPNVSVLHRWAFASACASKGSHHSRNTVSQAARLADEFGERLALVHATSGVEIYVPGGSHVLAEWKEAIVGWAPQEIAKLFKLFRVYGDGASFGPWTRVALVRFRFNETSRRLISRRLPAFKG
jgi:hypothetical protein